MNRQSRFRPRTHVWYRDHAYRRWTTLDGKGHWPDTLHTNPPITLRNLKR